MGAAQSRVELIARNFAETGVKDLMSCIYELLQKNQDRERVIQLRNEWVPVRPDSWKDKYESMMILKTAENDRLQDLVLTQKPGKDPFLVALGFGIGTLTSLGIFAISAEIVK